MKQLRDTYHTVFGVSLPNWFVEEVLRHYGTIDQSTVLNFMLKDYLKRNAPCTHPHYEVKYSWKDTEPPITSNKVCTTCNQCIE